MREGISFDLPAYQITEELPGYWCYAAVEQALRIALGREPMEQAQIVHRSFVNQAALEIGTSGDLEKQTRYHKLVIAQLLGEEAVANYADIYSQYNADQLPYSNVRVEGEIEELINSHIYGQIEWSAFAGAAGVKDIVDYRAIQQAIDAGQLIVYGDQFHWRVIYGYVDPENDNAEADEYKYLVWDPANGKGKRVPYYEVEAQVAIAVS